MTRVLVTGATGYVGGRLVPQLLEAGHEVSVYVRSSAPNRSSTSPAAAVGDVIEAIGGEKGWYSFPLAWAARGWIDRRVGGVGMGRGRRHPSRANSGDVIDVWRVEDIERGLVLLPFHGMIFKSMAKSILRDAERAQGQSA